MAKSLAFEKGWRVLVRVPGREGTHEGTVRDAGTRRVDGRRGLWVWVHINGHWELVPENKLEPKMDEGYYADFVADINRGSLSLKKGTLELKGGRVRVVTPSTDKNGYLKAKNGGTWSANRNGSLDGKRKYSVRDAKC